MVVVVCGALGCVSVRRAVGCVGVLGRVWVRVYASSVHLGAISARSRRDLGAISARSQSISTFWRFSLAICSSSSSSSHTCRGCKK